MLLTRNFPELWTFGSQARAGRGTALMFEVNLTSNAVAVAYSTLRRQGLTAGYPVTAGKTLLLTRALFRSDTPLMRFGVGYSDSDRAMNNAADGANPVNLDTTIPNGEGPLSAVAAGVMYDIAVYYEIPAGKFPRLVTPLLVAYTAVAFFGIEV